MAMATRNAAGMQCSLNPVALKQAAKKLQAEHQLSQANQLLDESVLVATSGSIGSDAGHHHLRDMMMILSSQLENWTCWTRRMG